MKHPTTDPRAEDNIIFLSDAQKADLKEAFELFDHEGVGLIANKDLKIAIRALGFEPTKEEVDAMIATVDTEGAGMLSYGNFLDVMTKKMSEKDEHEEIMKAFKLFDDDQKNAISFKNLKRVSTELGENLTDEELHEMIREADLSGDGKVTANEFVKIMKRTNI